MAERALVCSNIVARGRRQRTRAGLVLVGVSAVVFAALWLVHASTAARLLVGLPAGAAALILGQVTRNTCVGLASKGLAETEDGGYVKVDAEHDRVLRRTARGIVWRGVAVGVVVAALAALTSFV